MKKHFLFLFFGVFLTISSHSQILKKLGDKVNRKIENAVNKKVDNAIDKTLDKITDPKTSEKKSQPKEKTKKPKKKTQPKEETENPVKEAQPEEEIESPVKEAPLEESKPAVQAKEQDDGDDISGQSENQNDCEKEAEKKKGTWTQTKVYNYDHPTPNEKRFTPNMDKVLNAIADLVISSDPAPEGSRVEWEKWFTRSGDSVSTPDPFLHTYEFVARFLPFICKNGKVQPYGITDTWLFIRVNRFFPSEVTQQRQINTATGDKVFSLGKQIGTLDGYTWFEPAPTGIRQIPEVVYNSVLIHRPGKSPFIPVTRGEMLDMCKKWMAIAESGRIKATANVASIHANLDKLYDLNKNDLAQPAIIRMPEWNFNTLAGIDPGKQNIFTTPEDGYQLLRPDPSYVDPAVSKWRPQFMVVTWYKVTGKQNSAELDKVMREQFDFKKLGAMIN